MFCGTPLLCALLVWNAVILPAAWERGEDFAASGREVVSLVRAHFYDARRAEAWAVTHARYAEGIRTSEDFHDATRRVLALLGASHTEFYDRDDSEYYGMHSIFGAAWKRDPLPVESIGADIAPGGFVRVVFAGSPAEKAGLLRGDKLFQADGRDFQPVRSLRGMSGKPLTLRVQRRVDEPPRRVEIVPRSMIPSDEWLEAQSLGSRIVRVKGKSVAYMPFFSCSGEQYQQLLEEAITGKFAGADALVLDFRDGWGGCNPGFVNLFSRIAPAFTRIDRQGNRTKFDPSWRRPLVILINKGTRSGKEVVAYAVQNHGLGKLVGTVTAGAVLAGRGFPLQGDRGIVYLAVEDILVDNIRIEGKGVTPDILVPDAPPFAAGHDPQLEKALEVAAE